MLIFTSDMHLTDQTLAPSVPNDALELLIKELKQTARREKSVKLILLGDAFDILRSSKWLVEIGGKDLIYRSEDIRPWHAIDTPMERILHIILEDIKKAYKSFFDELNKIENLIVAWVPGNHDRLIKYSQSGKVFLKDLGIQSLGQEFLNRQYGVFARHGHFYDKFNIRGNKRYELAPFGDGLVIDILNRFQVEAAKKRKIINFDHEEIAFLGEMEYVRPYAKIPVWIHKRTKTLVDEILRNRIRDAWCDIVDMFHNNETLLLLGSVSKELFLDLLSQSKDFRSSLNRLIGILERLFSRNGKYLRHAYRESALRDKEIRLVVYGHTHKYEKHAFRSGGYYVNTGWWERSYKSTNGERRVPFFHGFHILKVNNGQVDPELKYFEVNVQLDWITPYKRKVSPIESLKEAEKAEAKVPQEAHLEKALIDLLAAEEGIKVRTLSNPTKQGFDMIVNNKVRQATFGRNVAIEIKGKVKKSDVIKLNQNVEKARLDKGWIFTGEKVAESVKQLANSSKIKIFDSTNLHRLKEGENFVSHIKNL